MIKQTMWRGSWMAAASVLAVLGCNTSTPSDVPVGAAQQALSSATVSASADTAVRAGFPNQNFGTQTDLDINRTLVQFSASALSSAVGPQDFVTAATLELTLTDNSLRRKTATRTVGAFRLASAWTETGATWNCAVDTDTSNKKADCSGATKWSMDAPAPNPWVTPATSTITIAAQQTGRADFDVTADVQGFVKGNLANYGWMLRGSTAGEFAEFASRETSTPPKLLLTIRRCSASLCDDGNACTVDSCDATANCTHSAAANGSSCSDGSACTQSDSCQAGACVGSNPVVCAAQDQCHQAGACNPTSGVCSNPALANGSSCNDGSACTQSDSCMAGTCVGSNPVLCTAQDQCHQAGACDPTSGACTNPALADGSSCNDGNACSQSDSCQAGTCTSGNPVVCAAPDQCHQAGACDPINGACTTPALADGSSCNDGQAFTQGDHCAAGACTGAMDLSRYKRVARYNLPEPTRTTPPNGTSLLAQEASGVTYDWDTDTLFVVGDGSTSVVQVSKTGALINSMTLPPGSSPQGTEFFDTEGISYVGGGKFAMNEERDRQVNLFTYVAGGTLQRADVQTVKLGTSIGNVGLEGLTWDPKTGHYIFVKEASPRSIFETGIDFAAGTATNGSPTTDESIDLFDPALVNTLDFSDVYALSNLPSLSGDPTYDQLLILSQESGKIVQVDRSGNVKHTLTLVADPSDTISVPDMTIEGMTMDRAGNLYLASENGGGDIDHPQLWVYAPSTATNLAPTAVSLTGAVTSLPESTSTTSPVKLADIFVADDGLGDNNLSVSGPDAGSFQIIGTALFLNAGTPLSAAAQSTYDITIRVDDPTVGATPDASTFYTLTITSGASGPITLAITEVAPWSSGNSPLAADWFELTNFGTSVVSLNGWLMDDNSNSSASAVPMGGVASIKPGESVIFIEMLNPSDLAAKAQSFINVWYGGAAPAGLQIGNYSGASVGLSTGGDAVNVFDSGGALHAAISFPASPSGTPLATFDNSAGLNNVAVSTLSVVGQFGAFVALSDVNEIGSPGTVGSGAAPIIGITAVDAVASETGSDPGLFRFARSGSTTSPLTVLYTIATGAGQATADDYTPTLTGSQIIPAGAASVDVTITPVDDAIVEGTEQLTLTLGDTGSYDVGAAASATVAIDDNDTANLAPTAVTLQNIVQSISEAANVSSRVRLADISVTDDGVGTNNLSVSGIDAASFEIVGTSLYLRAGTSLSHASKPTLSVSVAVDDPTVGATPDATAAFILTVAAFVAPGTIVISEVAPWSSSNSPLAADWFEVTNTGSSTVDITGWKVDDNSHSNANALVLNGITSIAPGEAVIFIETANLATAAAAFRSLWFGSNPPRVTQIGSYSGASVGLSSGGDEVTLFDGAGNMVTGVGFGGSPPVPFATFDNHTGVGGTTFPLTLISTLSAVGVNGAFVAAADANEIGSPGIGNVGRLIITEVAPWASSNSPYAADWFEVTNVGGAAVDMTGWKMDDNSNNFLTSVPIVGIGSVAPGQSIILIEGTSTQATNFVNAWFLGTPPVGFVIGSYTGSNVGLSTSGDAVNLFNTSGTLITGVQFGGATTGFTFDNRAGLASVTTLSVAGVNGAFLSPDSIETGSPGTAY